MDRRLYYLIPDRRQAIAVVDDLVQHGIGIDRINAVADRHTRMDGLPGAPAREARRPGTLQKALWNANTVCFAIALVATVLAPAFVGLSWWLLLPIVTMVVNFLTGLYLNSIAHKELSEFRDVVAHGEILLVVDIPEQRVAEIEQDIRQHHPRATSNLRPGWDTQTASL
ncbi:MAG: hypothetical protein R3F42_10995 [Pseudomonadota bacterium]